MHATHCKESTQPTFFTSSFEVALPHTSKDVIQELPLGWKIVHKKRLALVLKLGPGIGLDMAANTEKLPFLIAADMENGQEHFLCPGVNFVK